MSLDKNRIVTELQDGYSGNLEVGIPTSHRVWCRYRSNAKYGEKHLLIVSLPEQAIEEY